MRDLGITAPEWMDNAACRPEVAKAFPDDWFPDHNYDSKMARTLCKPCPVRAECLSHALETDSDYGVWGGLSERQRRGLHQAYRRTQREARRPA